MCLVAGSGKEYKFFFGQWSMRRNMSNSKKIYVCSYDNCKSSFMRLDRLESHTRLHRNERPYICSHLFCDKSYTQLQHLKRHENTHTKRSYKCTEENCNKVFISTEKLKNHVNNMHLKKKPKVYKCSYCDEQFNKHCWLTQHEYRHTGIKPYSCPTENCGKRFLFPSKLNRHMKVHQGYTCSKSNCNETFSKWTLYLKHLKVAHPINYICDICEKRFSTYYNLKAHSVVHGDFNNRTVFECPQPNCSRVYFVKRNLTHHIKSYHEKRTFICKAENCYKAFKCESDMIRHYAYQHDPNKRLRKKKKNKPKPSLAAILSGYIRKDKIAARTEVTAKPKVNGNSSSTLIDENNRINETDAPQMDVGGSELASELSSDAYQKTIKTCATQKDANILNVDKEIQELLNMINKNALNATSSIPKTNYVSLKEFIQL